MASGRSTMVHLFEWKWSDIADECEKLLDPVIVNLIQRKLYENLQKAPPPKKKWCERFAYDRFA
ncbi:alpha-amylase B [Apostichopus japonicus]|uniref:Alpha-amylase B n=1 Tax=Stichopus japonicus TaxID=307972 RepID=A0A2G8LD88_STIJA|nr:alpha-amylase B [Apostichopus japonicus]